MNSVLEITSTWVATAAWRTLPLFVVVWLLDRLARRHVPARFFRLLWILVVARLLIPVSIPSSYSLAGLMDRGYSVVQTEIGGLRQPSPTFGNKSDRDSDSKEIRSRRPDAATSQQAGAFQSGKDPSDLRPGAEQSPGSVHGDGGVAAPTADFSLRSLESSNLAIWNGAIWMWAGVAMALIARGCVAYVRFAVVLRRQKSVEDQDIVDRMLRACDSVGVGRRPPIREVHAVTSPAVFGIWRPVVCRPIGWRKRLSGDRLDWVFRHELAHIKRRDGIALLASHFATAVHWFNPLSWIAHARLHDHMERVADRAATDRLNESCARQYGDMLIEFASLQGAPPKAAILGFQAMSSSAGLKGRIESLSGRATRNRFRSSMATGGLAVLIAVFGLTDAIAEKEDTTSSQPTFPISEASVLAVMEQGQQKRKTSPRQLIKIDVQHALRKISESDPAIDAESYLLRRFGNADFVPG
ncbi:MAG: M56 family metallopeptidase, partial [Planctomycetota bacterium]